MIVFKATQAKVLAAFQAAAGVIDNKTVPILLHAKVEKVGGMVKVTGTNLEIEIVSISDLGGDAGNFSTTVEAKKIIDVLRSMPAEQIVTLEEMMGKLALKGGKSRVTLRTLPAEDFPVMVPSGVFSPIFTVPQKALKAVIDHVAFAMPINDYRHYLNGALFASSGDTLTMVVTNGSRIATASTPLGVDVPHHEVILPRKSVNELQRLLDGSEGALEVQFSGTQARVTFGNLTFLTKLIEGKFPDWRRAIPPPAPDPVNVARATLLNSLQRASIMSSEKFKGIRLSLSSGLLRINSINNNSEESDDEIEVDYDGPEIETGFNVNYLVDAVTNSKSDTLTLALGGAQTPLQMTLPGNDRFRYVASQLRL